MCLNQRELQTLRSCAAWRLSQPPSPPGSQLASRRSRAPPSYPYGGGEATIWASSPIKPLDVLHAIGNNPLGSRPTYWLLFAWPDFIRSVTADTHDAQSVFALLRPQLSLACAEEEWAGWAMDSCSQGGGGASVCPIPFYHPMLAAKMLGLGGGGEGSRGGWM